MKRILQVLIFILYAVGARAQQDTHPTRDNAVLHIPEAKTYSTDSISYFIKGLYSSPEDRLRAIYRWVTYSIRYDRDSMYAFNWAADNSGKISAALRRKKGVCENYAAVFSALCLNTGIECYVVTGYTKQSGRVDKIGHAWCAVSMDNEWSFCDPTWDEGYVASANYFMVPPARFIETHLPFDDVWQLLPYHISTSDFTKSGQHSATNAHLNFEAELREFLHLPVLAQLKHTAASMEKDGTASGLTITQIAYVKMQIAIIEEDQNMNLYNQAVAQLNAANDALNEFIVLRNNRFIPARPDSLISLTLIATKTQLEAAHSSVNALDALAQSGQYDATVLKTRLAAVASRLADQRAFLDRYLALDPTRRTQIFAK